MSFWHHWFGGFHMTSGVVGGVPQKADERNKISCFVTVTGGVKKTKILRTSYMEAPVIAQEEWSIDYSSELSEFVERERHERRCQGGEKRKCNCVVFVVVVVGRCRDGRHHHGLQRQRCVSHYFYRVSHPIVRDILSGFVLGVPRPCLGSR